MLRRILLVVFVVAILVAAITISTKPPHTKQKWERRFVGAQTCALCHKEQFERWKTSFHARATDVLPATQRQNKYCLSCHGVAIDDGFVGVQCEACHGGGTQYAKRYVMKDKKLAKAVGLIAKPTAETCKKCHTGIMPGLKKFNVEEALKKVRSLCTGKSDEQSARR